MKFNALGSIIMVLATSLAVVACGEVKVDDLADAAGSGDSRDGGAEPNCSDGLQNQGEEGVDCGGPCDACIECSGAQDCESGVCTNGSCAVSRLEACTDLAPANAASVAGDVATTFTPGAGWGEPAACAWQCNANYDLAGQSCINERLVQCVDEAPSNASSSLVSVTIGYSDAAGWATPSNCEWGCNADYAQSGDSCINTQQVPCEESPPSNGTSIAADVTISFTDAGGWTSPAVCDFSCNLDYCRNSSVCLYAYSEAKFDSGGSLGSAWFGGDDRPTAGPRNVGGGQRVQVGTQLEMAEFAFFYTRGFTSAQNGGAAVAVTLQLDLHDANGGSHGSAQASVPASFTGGWVWFGLSSRLYANTDYYFTSFLVNGYELGVNAGIRSFTDDSYADGSRVGATDSDGMTDLSEWPPWSDYAGTWDFVFWARSAPACAQ